MTHTCRLHPSSVCRARCTTGTLPAGRIIRLTSATVHLVLHQRNSSLARIPDDAHPSLRDRCTAWTIPESQSLRRHETLRSPPVTADGCRLVAGQPLDSCRAYEPKESEDQPIRFECRDALHMRDAPILWRGRFLQLAQRRPHEMADMDARDEHRDPEADKCRQHDGESPEVP